MAEKKFRSWVGFREEEERAPIANPVDRIRELESNVPRVQGLYEQARKG